MRHSLIKILFQVIGPCLILSCLLSCTPNAATSTADITYTWQVSPMPPKVGAIQINIQIKNPNSKFLSESPIEIEGNMSHPGMVPVRGNAPLISESRYQGNLVTTMAGDWIIFLKIKLKNGEIIEKNFPLRIHE